MLWTDVDRFFGALLRSLAPGGRDGEDALSAADLTGRMGGGRGAISSHPFGDTRLRMEAEAGRARGLPEWQPSRARLSRPADQACNTHRAYAAVSDLAKARRRLLGWRKTCKTMLTRQNRVIGPMAESKQGSPSLPVTFVTDKRIIPTRRTVTRHVANGVSTTAADRTSGTGELRMSIFEPSPSPWTSRMLSGASSTQGSPARSTPTPRRGAHICAPRGCRR